MALFEEIEQETTSRKYCPVGYALLDLNDEEKAELVRALATSPKRIPSTAISRVLRRREISIDEETIAKHRKGFCRCPGLTTN